MAHMRHGGRNMKPLSIAITAVLSIGVHTALAQPKLPDTAKLLTGPAIAKQLSNRSFRFVVHDTGFEAYGTSTWDPQQHVVYGDVVWGSLYRGPWKKEWMVTDSHSCFRDAGVEKWDCYRIYVDGTAHFEVRDDGVIHSVHTPLGN
jgi:hypothetical protein